MDHGGGTARRGVAVSIAVTLVVLLAAAGTLWQAREDAAPEPSGATPPGQVDVRTASEVDGSPDCGEPLTKADGEPWTCTFADDFDGDALDLARWVPQTDFSVATGSSRACTVSGDDNVSVADGRLRLAVRRVVEPTSCHGEPAVSTGATVSTSGLFSQQYGRVEARIKVTAARQPGLHESFWLWPDTRIPSDDAWPAAGEIDISETYSADPDLSIPYLHYTAWDNGGPVPGVNTSTACEAARGEWHTYVLTWTATRLTIEVDGEPCLLNTADDPAFDKPYVVGLSAALGIDGAEYGGTIPLPATTYVDHVRVWK